MGNSKSFHAVSITATMLSLTLINSPANADEISAKSKLAKIIASCTYISGKSADLKSCLVQFKDRYERSDREIQATAGFTFFGILKGNYQNFSGNFEELNYTELTFGGNGDPNSQDTEKNLIQYQIGFGFILASQNYKANVSATPNLIGQSISASAEKGKTSYAASLIGIAPDPAAPAANLPKCGDKTMLGADELLCALDMQPTVTQAYFRNAASMLAHGYADWRSEVQQAASGKLPIGRAQPRICPQIIAFRRVINKDGQIYFDPKNDLDPKVDPTTFNTVARNAQILAKQLQSACPGIAAAGGNAAQPALPNAAVRYHNGEPFGIGVTDKNSNGTNANKSKISLGYFRDVNFLALSGKFNETQRKIFYEPSDQYFDLWLDGLKNAESLPSVLAAIATFSRTSSQQALHVHLCQAAGQPPVGIAGDPIANPDIFTQLTADLKAAVDGPPSPIQNCDSLS